MKKFLGLVVLVLISFTYTLAQKSVKGKVMDEKSKPIRNAKVSVDGSKYVYTQANGSFEVNSQQADGPKVVKADIDGLVLKDWKIKGNEVEVIMAPPRKLTGRVMSDRNVPVRGISVLLIGVRGIDAVKTDLRGYFNFTVPQTLVITSNSFVLYDPGRLKGQANYEIKIGEDGVYYILVDIPPRAVRTVKMIDETGKPLSKELMQVDGIRYTTNENGEFKTNESANDFSEFQSPKLFITKLEYEDLTSTMTVSVRKPNTSEGDTTQGAVTIIDDKIENISESILIEKSVLEERQERISSEIQKTEQLLASGKNISPEERKRLEEKLILLRKEFDDNAQALRVASEKAVDAYLQIQEAYSLQKEKTKAEIEAAETARKNALLEKKLTQERANRNILIFSVVGAALLLVAAVFYINNRKISGQKNQLAEKNLMLEESARIMDEKNKQIHEKNDQLVVQTQELEEKNAKITDSIRYAQTIQQSILPNSKEIGAVFSEFFIFYAPRDIVSGDFYWFTKKDSEIIITAADCTGHGVPGAFMTVMGNTLLNQIVNINSITDPAEILSVLNERVRNTLKQQKEGELRDGDGMDMALLKINTEEKLAYFAGAKNPLYYVKGDELLYIKGSNISIGGTLKNQNKEFKNRCLELDGDEIFYLVSDGFQDQLGGLDSQGKRKKYMKTRFMDFIKHVSKFPLLEQEKMFKAEFNNWKGNHDQTDDVVVIAFKL
ncbi:MAG: SpoIIE family protein phosphatase [Microscillaceae bacterium]|nr:SpoIIE family protein phosphatase [Microscillaceae bacterium]